MASNQAYYLCIKHLTGECKYSVCKNVHPENIKQANEEYVNKKIPRICYKFNFGPDGCPFKVCKFLHIYIKHQPSNTIIQQVSTPVKIDNLLSNIRSAESTIGRTVNVCGQIGVIAKHCNSWRRIGPPAERLCAVEPTGVLMIKPSQL